MDYAAQKRVRLPIGSGVTEAACKTVFTQRLKQSGMSWKLSGGQVVLNLRVLLLSQTWSQVHAAYLNSKVLPHTSTNTSLPRECFKIAA
jgi:hypothetical protein